MANWLKSASERLIRRQYRSSQVPQHSAPDAWLGFVSIHVRRATVLLRTPPTVSIPARGNTDRHTGGKQALPVPVSALPVCDWLGWLSPACYDRKSRRLNSRHLGISYAAF